MKKYLLALIGAFVFSSIALASDLPVRPPVVKAPPAQQLFDWSGWHINLSGGYSWSSVNNSAGGFSVDSKPKGGHIAVGLGYDTVINGQLFGIEGDIGLLSGSGSAGGGLITNEGSYIATLRGRYGLPIMPNLLLYGTGGVYAASNKFSVLGITDEKVHLSYVVGAGLETKIKNNWRGRLEYLYLGKDKETYTVLGTSINGKMDTHITRIGMVYDF